MQREVVELINHWQRRNITGFYCENKDAAAKKLLEIIPATSTVGRAGSLSLDELGIMGLLEGRGNKVFDQYKPGLSEEAGLEIRRQGTQADYYLTSANALSAKGELIFLSAYASRSVGLASAKNLIVICGVNKITSDIETALRRARHYATPLNCRRLNWNTPCAKDGVCKEPICRFPEYKRMCCQVFIIEAEITPDRLKVVLIGENLGY